MLDPEEITKPPCTRTILLSLPLWAYHKIQSRIAGVQSNHEQVESENLEVTTIGEDADSALKQDSRNGIARKRGKRNGKA